MEFERKTNLKSSNLNPKSIKENNFNCVNIFDTNLSSKKTNVNGFKQATKLMRNFK